MLKLINSDHTESVVYINDMMNMESTIPTYYYSNYY